MERVAESEIVLNQHVFVSIVGQETEENVTFKPLILTPPAKIVENYLLLRFHQKILGIHVPDIIRKMNNKKTASRNKMSIKFYIPQWTVDKVITNNTVIPCQNNRATYFYVIYRLIYKKRAMRVSVLRDTCVLLKLELFLTQLY